MERIEIFWGADKDFEEATEKLEAVNFFVDVVNHITKTDLKIEGVGGQTDPPMEVKNLLVHTDDYGGVKEWALLTGAKVKDEADEAEKFDAQFPPREKLRLPGQLF